MSDNITWIFAAAIKEGELENFKALAAEMIAATEADEPGALNYEWFINDDASTCHILERYADSDAALVHLGNFGKKFAGNLMSMVKPKGMTVYGSPSDELSAALANLGATIMPTIGGFAR